jgi:hypothetical protein
MLDATLVSGSRVLHRNRPDFYPSPNIIWNNNLRMRWEGDVAYTSGKRNSYRILIEKPEEKGLGRQKCTSKLQHIVTVQTLYEQRNIVARSDNHCCRGKAINVTYVECVFAALGIQYAMRMTHLVICGVSGR